MTGSSGPRHKARFTGTNTERAPDGRLLHPTCFRNLPPLIVALQDVLGDAEGPVLEIGSGTGQHAAAFALAFPRLAWWPSDPDPEHRASIAAWQEFCRASERAPFDLDAASDWPNRDEIRALGPLRAVYTMNVIHIAPVRVMAGILAGAARALAPGGLLIFYGPFHENGQATGAGNARFDAGLRAETPEWGIRDIADVTARAREAGFAAPDIRRMPADNRLVVFRKP